MAKEEMTLEEWGNRIFEKLYVVLDFDYDMGKTWVLNTKDGRVYEITYDSTHSCIIAEEINYTMDWEDD